MKKAKNMILQLLVFKAYLKLNVIEHDAMMQLHEVRVCL